MHNTYITKFIFIHTYYIHYTKHTYDIKRRTKLNRQCSWRMKIGNGKLNVGNFENRSELSKYIEKERTKGQADIMNN